MEYFNQKDIDFEMIINNLYKKKLKVESVMITYRKKNYKHFFKKEELKDIRSISKLISGLALGVAIEKGYFKNGIETYVLPYFQDEKISNKENLKYLNQLQIKHLITYTTGYDKQVLNKAYLKNEKSNRYTEIALNYPFKYAPGEKFVFSNASIYLLSILIEKETTMKLSEFVKENIFNKMNISTCIWEENEENHTWGATGLKLYPSDLHKIGLMLLNGGIYDRVQVVSKKWTEEMKKLRNLSPDDYVKGRVVPKYGHGYTLWLCENGIYYHDAKGGQYVICVPDKNMVITITADDEEHRHEILEEFRNVIL